MQLVSFRSQVATSHNRSQVASVGIVKTGYNVASCKRYNCHVAMFQSPMPNTSLVTYGLALFSLVKTSTTFWYSATKTRLSCWCFTRSQPVQTLEGEENSCALPPLRLARKGYVCLLQSPKLHFLFLRSATGRGVRIAHATLSTPSLYVRTRAAI